ncbi:MAG: phage portal protein [Bacillota bacterium]
MGLIKQLLFKKYSLADLDRDMKMVWGSLPTKSGVQVNEHTALRYITFYSCVRVRSESFSMLPLSVYRKRRNGKGRDEAYDHPVHDKIHSVPNSEMTSLTWRETMNAHLDASGNCYSIISTNKRGQVIDLYPWPWDQVEVVRNKETGKIEYKIYENGRLIETLPPERVLHVPGLGYDGIKGYSTIAIVREYVGLGLSVSEFIRRFYGQGMNVGSVLETDQAMEQESVDALREAFMERGSGLANSWLPIVLHSGLKFNRIPMPLTDAQTIEILKLTDDQICGLMRVPPHMVANLERSTNNNIEHQGIEYVQYSMLPVTTRFEQVMNWKLFTPAERAEGYYVKFKVDALLRGDAQARGSLPQYQAAERCDQRQ